MIGNVEAAEDFTQEAFLQLYRKIATFRGDSAFSTWLHRITVNVVLTPLRKKGLIEVSLEETLEPTDEGGPQKEIAAHDQILAGSLDRVILDRAVGSIPPGYRVVFFLHDIEGVSTPSQTRTPVFAYCMPDDRGVVLATGLAAKRYSSAM
jgi:RNA polymerase sigma-70 factor, ECF subfamily